jgi:hypothetical protein
MKQIIQQLKEIALGLKHAFERSLPLILIGAALGYTFNQAIERKIKRYAQAEEQVAFATVEDMSFLVQELKDCREGSLGGSY